MINPDIHISIYISEEVVRIVCATVAFIVMMWLTRPLYLSLAKKEQMNENEST